MHTNKFTKCLTSSFTFHYHLASWYKSQVNSARDLQISSVGAYTEKLEIAVFPVALFIYFSKMTKKRQDQHIKNNNVYDHIYNVYDHYSY